MEGVGVSERGEGVSECEGMRVKYGNMRMCIRL